MQVAFKIMRNQAVEQTGQRGFAAAALAAEHHYLLIRNGQVNIRKAPGRSAGGVGKRDVLDFNHPIHLLPKVSAMQSAQSSIIRISCA